MFDHLIAVLDGKDLGRDLSVIRHDRALIKWLVEVTPKLDGKYQMSNRIYWVLNDIRNFIRCRNPDCPV